MRPYPPGRKGFLGKEYDIYVLWRMAALGVHLPQSAFGKCPRNIPAAIENAVDHHLTGRDVERDRHAPLKAGDAQTRPQIVPAEPALREG